MALTLGTGLIETRGDTKLPKLQSIMNKVLDELGFEQTYEGKAPPEENPEDGATTFELLANGDGVLAIRVSEDRVVRDLARMMSKELSARFEVFMTSGSLFGRRSVEVVCRRFDVRDGEEEELPVMVTHTAEVTDVEHNELRQAENALRSRINNANDSLLQAEASSGFKLKKLLRYKKNVKKIKWSSPRLGRLMEQIEACDSFEVTEDRGQPMVKVELSGARSMAYLKPDELTELEAALQGRPEIAHRRQGEEG